MSLASEAGVPLGGGAQLTRSRLPQTHGDGKVFPRSGSGEWQGLPQLSRNVESPAAAGPSASECMAH